ncbi:MAG: gliding motility-associated C-terminal domain-containing protein [Bacteroidales bacterium]|nr:gliding motility-associated C-terminal domain-containing protein [Bacteroidales bacterium]
MKNNFYKILFVILSLICYSESIYAQLNVDFTFSTSKNCNGSVIEFKNTTSGSYKFAHFDFGDGTDSYGNELQHVYSKAGEYKVTMWLLYSDETISDKISKPITIVESPEVTLENDKLMSVITANSNQEVSYEWFQGSKKIDNSSDNKLFYFEDGTYSVKVTNGSGCTDSTSIKVNALDKNSPNATLIKVANNVITPSLEDGINDVLYIEDLTEYASACIVKIFDKRGKIVYSNDNYSNTNGFKGVDDSGNELFAGTYYYIIKSQGRKGATGYVDIIR